MVVVATARSWAIPDAEHVPLQFEVIAAMLGRQLPKTNR